MKTTSIGGLARGSAISFLLFASWGAAGCDQAAPSDVTGSVSAALASESVGHDVAKVDFRVVKGDDTCEGKAIASRIVPLESESLPTNMLPSGGGNSHRFADGLFVLAPGSYRICATPLKSDGTKSAECGQASGLATVMAKATTEIVLVSQCKGTPNGAVDGVVVLNDPPLITDLVIGPSKFIGFCEDATIDVAASDPNGDAITFAWSITSSPPGACATITPTGSKVTFQPEAVGNYEIKVAATDALGAHTSLKFPIHVDGECRMNAVADAHIRADVSARKNDNYGCQSVLVVGTGRDEQLGVPDQMRALVRFDLSRVPAGAVIQSAIMEMTVYGFDITIGPTTAFKLDVNQILGSGPLTPWLEGNGVEFLAGGSPMFDPPPGCVEPDSAEGVAWIGAGDGGDANNQTQPAFDPVVAASATLDASVSVRGDVVRWDLTALAKAWQGGTPNFGVVVRETATAGGFQGVLFGARDGALRGYPAAWVEPGPRLVVTLAP